VLHSLEEFSAVGGFIRKDDPSASVLIIVLEASLIDRAVCPSEPSFTVFLSVRDIPLEFFTG
jgi:hypothetical protein